MKTKLATAIAATMLAASSLAYAADNSGNNNNDSNGGTMRDEQTTGAINSEGRTLTPAERERCQANPNDADCQGLGGEINQ